MSAYRAEKGGLVNIFHILLSICKYHGISGGSVIIYCDCKTALNKLQRDTYGDIKDYLVPDYDLLNEGGYSSNNSMRSYRSPYHESKDITMERNPFNTNLMMTLIP